MVKEDIVRKIRKLFALSESPNENEAARALEHANRLLLQYNLSMYDIEDEIDLGGIIEEVVEEGGKVMSWRLALLNTSMRLNNCTIIISSIRRGTKTLKAVGRKSNIDVSLLMFDYLLSTLDRMMKEDQIIKKMQNSYRVGFCHSIEVKVKEIIKKRDEEFVVNCKDLVVLEKQLVNKFMAEKYKNLRISKRKDSATDSSGYFLGRLAGDSTSLNSQIKN